LTDAEVPHQRTAISICELEKKALGHRSFSARIGDVIATQAGRMWFIFVHLLWFSIYLLLNMKPHGGSTFDSFPFSLLTMVVSLESIFLSVFILMSCDETFADLAEGILSGEEAGEKVTDTTGTEAARHIPR
jgi:uncharacterized membrane protein